MRIFFLFLLTMACLNIQANEDPPYHSFKENYSKAVTVFIFRVESAALKDFGNGRQEIHATIKVELTLKGLPNTETIIYYPLNNQWFYHLNVGSHYLAALTENKNEIYLGSNPRQFVDLTYTFDFSDEKSIPSIQTITTWLDKALLDDKFPDAAYDNLIGITNAPPIIDRRKKRSLQRAIDIFTL